MRRNITVARRVTVADLNRSKRAATFVRDAAAVVLVTGLVVAWLANG